MKIGMRSVYIIFINIFFFYLFETYFQNYTCLKFISSFHYKPNLYKKNYSFDRLSIPSFSHILFIFAYFNLQISDHLKTN